jgi:hypothetical protein
MWRARVVRVRALQHPAQDPRFAIGAGAQHFPNQQPEDALDICGKGF